MGGWQGDRRGIAPPGGDECPRCGRRMDHTKDMTKRNGRWIHKWCSSGGDDE